MNNFFPIVCQCGRALVYYPPEEHKVCEECKVNPRPPLITKKNAKCIVCHGKPDCILNWRTKSGIVMHVYACMKCNPLKGYNIDNLVIEDLS